MVDWIQVSTSNTTVSIDSNHLPISDLIDWLRRSSRLAIGHDGSSTRSGTATVDSLDVDGSALLFSGLVVQVVEGAAQALLEDNIVADGEGVVLADRPSGSVDSAGLGRAIELELTVGGDVTSASLSILENTARESEDQSTTALSLLLGRGGHVDDLDLESAWVVARAAGRSRGRRSDVLGDSLRNCNGSSDGREGNGGNGVTHFVDDVVVGC